MVLLLAVDEALGSDPVTGSAPSFSCSSSSSYFYSPFLRDCRLKEEQEQEEEEEWELASRQTRLQTPARSWHGAASRLMPVAAANVPASSELTPFLWIAGFALCFALHLVIHPQARVFRDALRWLGTHPAPLLWLMASLMLSKAWTILAKLSPDASVTMHAATPWPEAFVMCLAEAWRRLALVFHAAILPPQLWSGTLGGAALQALISATGQMWLACYVVASRQPLIEDTAAVRRTAERWRVIAGLALCHLPWWWAESRTDVPFVRDWLLPEFLLFLAPLPLAAAAERVDFFKAGTLTLRWWRQSWGQMLVFALTALPLLVLLEYCLRLLPGAFATPRLLLRVLLESVLASAVHVWLFVSAALLLLRGAYVAPDTPDD
jgi:hypothetical protein